MEGALAVMVDGESCICYGDCRTCGEGSDNMLETAFVAFVIPGVGTVIDGSASRGSPQ
jgi:hypothetical protein